MRGVGQMSVITIGILSALACEGCTAFVAEEYPVAANAPSIVLETTHAMRVAVPAPLGALPEAKPEARRQLTAYESLQQAENILLEYGVALPARYADTSTVFYGFAANGREDALTLSLMTGFDREALEQTAWSAAPALRVFHGQLGTQRLLTGDSYAVERYGAEFAFAAPREATGLGFDIGVVPSASYAEEGDFSVRRIGAEFRFGQDIDQRGSNRGLPSWYFFAGADGEAVIFNNGTAGRGFGLIDGLQLRDQVTVGDIQAGLNINRYGTNFAINYIRREVEFELDAQSVKRDEDFGGISLTWRR